METDSIDKLFTEKFSVPAGEMVLSLIFYFRRIQPLKRQGEFGVILLT
jgi:hypothetical protein